MSSLHIARFGARLYFALGVAAISQGCAIDIPIAAIVGLGLDADRTSALASPAKLLSPHLTDDDWVKAKPALKLAFAPESAGRATHWSNASTGFGGSFAAGPVSETDGIACGAVRFTLSGVPDGGVKVGRACRALSGEWVMKGVEG